MMAHLWWYLDILSLHQLKKGKRNFIKSGPSLTKRSGSANAVESKVNHIFERSLSADYG